ncbi:DUF3990 domain-containing protein [Bacteroidales bacterium OttesenSCG-928-B11]|nr:DUF3990 domain-containing protein [Bacteroidales bacterium OttesenSCG-928-B11]
MEVYHGSYITVETPKILESKFSKDFGKGFYCTELEKQAVRWASRYANNQHTKFVFVAKKH